MSFNSVVALVTDSSISVVYDARSRLPRKVAARTGYLCPIDNLRPTEGSITTFISFFREAFF